MKYDSDHLLIFSTATQKWETTACDNPVRNVSPLTEKVIWVMFSVTTLAIGFRLLARLTFLEGNIGWDDYAIFTSYAGLIPCTVIMEISTSYTETCWRSADCYTVIARGLGQDVWMISFDGVTDILFVSTPRTVSVESLIAPSGFTSKNTSTSSSSSRSRSASSSSTSVSSRVASRLASGQCASP